MTATALSTSYPSPTTSTASPSSAFTPTRNIAWSSTMTTRTLLSSVMALLVGSMRTRQSQPHLGSLAARRPDVGRAAVAVHPVHDAAAHAHPVGRYVGRVEAHATVTHE